MAALLEDGMVKALAPQQPVKLVFTWRSRFYTAVLDRDLFGQWSVTRSWGSTRNGQGGGRMSVVESFEAGEALLKAIRRRRERLGYKLA
jgi:hypothetical protein